LSSSLFTLGLLIEETGHFLAGWAIGDYMISLGLVSIATNSSVDLCRSKYLIVSSFHLWILSKVILQEIGLKFFNSLQSYNYQAN